MQKYQRTLRMLCLFLLIAGIVLFCLDELTLRGFILQATALVLVIVSTLVVGGEGLRRSAFNQCFCVKT
jgi:hypothetical protein